MKVSGFKGLAGTEEISPVGTLVWPHCVAMMLLTVIAPEWCNLALSGPQFEI